jgi:dihydroflavonol-4-reductase
MKSYDYVKNKYSSSGIVKAKVLVTGADGFLGSHVVRRALDEGYLVRAFIQSGRQVDVLDGLPVERFEGDLLKYEDIKSALDGCDVIIHTAASTAVWPSRAEWIWKINYDAVGDLAEEVIKQNIKRFVYIGSASSFGYGSMEEPGDEGSPFLGKKFGLDYLDSKKKAQDYLIREHKENDLPVIILNPTYMIGEYDTAPGSGKMVLAVGKQQLPGYTSGGKCVVYVGDVAQAAVNAIQKGNLGECYITGGENLSYKEFYKIVSKLTGARELKLKIPTLLVVFMGYCMELLAKITKKAPLFSACVARLSKDGHYYRSDKAIRVLGMPQTSARDAIQKAVDYFFEVGSL